MQNLIFSLNATIPVFFVMAAGYLLRRIGILNGGFVETLDKFNFWVTLPILLITDLGRSGFLSSLGYPFCPVLFFRHTGQYCGRGSSVASGAEEPVGTGRVHTGFFPGKRGGTGDRFYSEYLWKCGDGTADDAGSRSSL